MIILKNKTKKINKILIIISLIIIGVGVLSGIGVSIGLLNGIGSISDVNSLTLGFEILFQFAGSVWSVYFGFLIVIFAILLVTLIWIIYGIILLIIKLINRVKNKKILLFSLILIVIICIIVIGLIFKEDKVIIKDDTIGSIAYNVNSDENYIVYIKEQDKYIPYLVIDNNYNNKGTLLIRENVYGGTTGYVVDYNGTISKDKIYNEQLYMEKYTHYDSTQVDKFLSNNFINYYDSELVNLMIENELIFEDYSVTRKLFILSLGEVSNIDSYDNDKQLKYFSDSNRIVKNDIRAESIWWTRTDCYVSWCAIGMTGAPITTSGTNARYGVRPAFVIPSDTKIERVYIEETDELYVEVNVIDY